MVSVFHECEVKYKVGSDGELKGIRRMLLQKGFVFGSIRTEIDFTPDVPGFVCKENGFMIRFRRIVGETSSDIIVTMKVKGSAKNFQEYFEYEYALSSYKPEVFKEINRKLRKITGITLPKEINTTNDFKELVRLLRTSGFSEHRLLLEKVREEYKREDFTIEIDLLPEGIGYYIEIEAGSPERLATLVAELGLPEKDLSTSNYGGILKDYKKDYPEILKRTGLFSKNYEEYGIQ